jgi:hypothetical protein
MQQRKNKGLKIDRESHQLFRKMEVIQMRLFIKAINCEHARFGWTVAKKPRTLDHPVRGGSLQRSGSERYHRDGP